MRTVVELASVAVAILSLSGCCNAQYPTARPSGAFGAFARAIPPDGAQPLDARAGLVAPPASGWDPKATYGNCTDGKDELAELERSLAVTSVGCPMQYAPAPAIGSAGSAATLGFNVYCYPVGSALLLVETTEMLGSCKHIVGLGVFHRQGS